MDRMLVFRLGWGSLNDLPDSHLWFTCDGEGSATRHGMFGMSGVVTVGGRQVDSDATVITQAFEAAVLPFLLREFAICPNAWCDWLWLCQMTQSGCCPILLVQRMRQTACSDQRVWSSHPGIPSNECC